jgi:hypothetical protein
MRIHTAGNVELRRLKRGALKLRDGGTPMKGPEFDKMVNQQVEEMLKSGDHIFIHH